MTAWTESYNSAVPAGGDDPREADDVIRSFKDAVAERLGVDHYFTESAADIYDAADTGEHSKITIRTLSAAQIAALSSTKAYIYRAESDNELYFQDGDGHTLKLTEEGKLNFGASTVPADSVDETMILLSNTGHLRAVDKAGTGEVELLVAGRNEADDTDVAVLPDLVRLDTNAAPTEDTQIPNKKYVDDQIAAAISVAADGSTVFNARLSVDEAWQDLDLSAKVGANVAMVYLEVTGSATVYFAVKPKGYGSADVGNHYQGEIAGASACYLNSVKVCYLTCMTDSSGVIQIGGSDITTTITLKLVGYVK